MKRSCVYSGSAFISLSPRVLKNDVSWLTFKNINMREDCLEKTDN